MRLSNLRILIVSLGAGMALGAVGGFLWTLLADTNIWHAVGTGLSLIGIIAFGVGALGATEPPEGWATGRRRSERRRSALRVVTQEHPRFEEASSLDLAVWGIVVGGGLIGLAVLAFNLAA